MTKENKRKVLVSLPSGSGLTEIDMLKLLSESEIDLSSVQFIQSSDEGYDMQKDDALIVVLSKSDLADEKTDAAVISAAQSGSCHIVGIWAPEESQTNIHPMVEKYGTAQIPWDADKLKNELGSDCENVFQTPDGDKADPKEIDPNECD